MSTTKPRITITLEPHTHEVLTRLSAAGGDSMSQIVTGFLSVCVPSMERMVVVMEHARAAPEEARAGLKAAIDKVERTVLPSLVDGLEQQDLFLAAVVDAAVGASGDAARAPRALRPRSCPSTPVPVTRGSGRTKVTTRCPAKGGRHG